LDNFIELIPDRSVPASGFLAKEDPTRPLITLTGLKSKTTHLDLKRKFQKIKTVAN